MRKVIQELGPQGAEDLLASRRTPETRLLRELVNGALEAMCRGVSVPKGPEGAKIRAFIFQRIGDELVCSHHWSPNPVRERVGKLCFPLTKEWAERVTVTEAAVSQQIVRKTVDPDAQRALATAREVPSNLKLIVAAPIFNEHGKIWGVVDFDTATEHGYEVLSGEFADATLYHLARHLSVIFSLPGHQAASG